MQYRLSYENRQAIKDYYARNKSDDKDLFTEKLIEVTAYINKIKKDLRMCDEIENEVAIIEQQMKEFYEKEAERELSDKNKKKSNIENDVK